MRRLLPQSTYARNVLTLMTGTTLAQAIPIAISPILTRMYSPADFGSFALYMAIAMIASVAVTGRYEQAIVLPLRDRDALHITALAMALSVIVSALLLVIVVAFARPIATLLGDPTLAPWLYWVPASTLLLGVYQSLYYWSNRKAQYRRLAISRTLQGGTAALTQLGTGYAGSGAGGLVAGQLAGQIVATGILARMIWREDHGRIRALRPLRSLALAKKYIDFPRYLIVAHGFNTASHQMPILLLSAFFSTTTAGFFILTQRVIAAPMSLVANALGDVFRQEASDTYIRQGNCQAIYRRTFKRLLSISLVPFIIFFFAAPSLFSWVFGQPWREAGEYAQILTPMAFLNFITSPLSSMFMIAEQQRLDLVWQILLLIFVIASFLSARLLFSATGALVFFSATYCVAYVINGLMTHHFAKNGA